MGFKSIVRGKQEKSPHFLLLFIGWPSPKGDFYLFVIYFLEAAF